MDICKENCIEWITGDKQVYITFSQKKYITKIKKIAKENTDVHIIAENQDGSIYATIPLGWVKISPQKSRELTEEQRAAASERLRIAREKKMAEKLDNKNETQ